MASAADSSSPSTEARALEERALAVAEGLAAVTTRMSGALRDLTDSSVEYMAVYRDTAEHTAQAVSTSVAHARNLVEKCERLDAEMSKVEALAAQVRAVKASLSTLESSLGPAERT